MAAQQRDPALLGVGGGRLHRVVAEQRAGPPADLVVGKIADAVGRAAKRRDRLSGNRHHAALGFRRKRVEPVKFGAPPEFEVDDGGEPQFLRRQ